MGKVWVKAITIVYGEENGKSRAYHPGDWLQMGRQQARELLTKGQVEILKPATLQSVQDLYDCAILTTDVIPEPRLSNLAGKFPGVPIQQFDPENSQFTRYLRWQPEANLNQTLIVTGLHLLKKFQIAVPIQDYHLLATDIGTETERKQTEKIIHDLRVPVYDTRVMFIRQCTETDKLLKLWDYGSQLEFLQALYQIRPLILALPPSWIL